MSSGLKHFVSQYQKLSRIPDPVIETINVSTWSEKISLLGSKLIPDGNTHLDISHDEDMSEILADEKLLNQVMLNLIRNAVEAPKIGKRKKINIHISLSDEGKSIIRVVNDGEAISPEIRDQIFIPFFSTKNTGDGIGLFLSRQIIYMHQGDLIAYTNKDRETVFEIAL